MQFRLRMLIRMLTGAPFRAENRPALILVLLLLTAAAFILYICFIRKKNPKA